MAPPKKPVLVPGSFKAIAKPRSGHEETTKPAADGPMPKVRSSSRSRATIVPFRDMPVHIGLEDLRSTDESDDSSEFPATIDHYGAKVVGDDEFLLLSLEKGLQSVRVVLRMRISRARSRIDIMTSEPPPGLDADDYYHFSTTTCKLTLKSIQTICDALRMSIPPFISDNGSEGHWFCMEFLWQLEKRPGASSILGEDSDRRHKFRAQRILSHETARGGNQEGYLEFPTLPMQAKRSVHKTLSPRLQLSRREPTNKPMQIKPQWLLYGHSEAILSTAFIPGSQTHHVVSGSADKTVGIWRIGEGQHVREPMVGHTDWVSAVAVTNDGDRVASASQDGSICLWDWKAGSGPVTRPDGHRIRVASIAFTPDGRHLVSGSGDKTLRVWDSLSGKPICAPLVGHTSAVWSVAVSPQGDRIASCSVDKSIRLWDVRTWKPSCDPLRGHTQTVTSVAFSPDGNHLASCSDDVTVRLWNTATGKSVGRPFNGHRSVIMSVAFTPSGQYIASGSFDKTVRIWSVDKQVAVGKPLQGHSGAIHTVAVSPDGRYLASGSDDRTIRAWEMNN